MLSVRARYSLVCPMIIWFPVLCLTQVAGQEDTHDVHYSVRFTMGEDATPVRVVRPGGEVTMHVYVQDLRPEPRGVFSGYVDVEYDAEHLSTSGDLMFGEVYRSGISGTNSTPGLLNEVGGVDGITPLDGRQFELFRQSFSVGDQADGFAVFRTDGADDLVEHPTTLFGESQAVPPERIRFGRNSLYFSPTANETALMRHQLVATDLNGNPINEIGVGEDFLLSGIVEDIRDNPQGVFSSYADILFDQALVEVTGEIQFGSGFPNAQAGEVQHAGFPTIDNLGAVGNLTPPGGGEQELFHVPMRSKGVGMADLTAVPESEPTYESTLYGMARPVDFGEIAFESAQLRIVPEPHEGLLMLTAFAMALLTRPRGRHQAK